MSPFSIRNILEEYESLLPTPPGGASPSAYVVHKR